MSRELYRKWASFLDRVEREQLRDLLVNRHVFMQIRRRFVSRRRSDCGQVMYDWAEQVYVAFATTAVRRMSEPGRLSKVRGWRSVSLVALLEDLAVNESVLTRERFRSLYKPPIPRSRADQDFARIVRSKSQRRMTASRIERDIKAIKKASDPIKRLADKSVAHTDRDRRTIGKVSLAQLDKAICLLHETVDRYHFLLHGMRPSLIPLDEFDVSEDVDRLFC